jgi:hypothetical protein
VWRRLRFWWKWNRRLSSYWKCFWWKWNRRFGPDNLAQALIAAIHAVLVSFKPVVFIGIASIRRICGVAISTTFCADKGIIIGASLLEAYFITALLFAGWFFPTNLAQALIAAIHAILVSLKPVVFIGIASICRICGVAISTTFCADKGIIVGASLLEAYFVTALLFAGWFATCGEVAALGTGAGSRPILGSIIASTLCFSIHTNVGMLV